jgi:hypothetical protein
VYYWAEIVEGKVAISSSYDELKLLKEPLMCAEHLSTGKTMFLYSFESRHRRLLMMIDAVHIDVMSIKFGVHVQFNVVMAMDASKLAVQ